MQEIPLNRQRRVTKYVSGHFATGRNMNKWKFRSITKCPRCPEPIEDKQHILECPNTEAQELWEKALKQLDEWLKAEGTERSIREQLIHGLRSWTTPNLQATQNSPLEAQESIGKRYMWDGWLSREWQWQQDQIWKQLKSRKSSRRWTAEIIKKIWNTAWDMWEHRNNILHDSEQNREAILEHNTNKKIRQTYASGTGQLARTDFRLMANTLEYHLGQPHHTKKLWLASIEAAIHRRRLHEHGAMTAEQRLMETWVVRNPPRPPPTPISQ